MRFQIPTHLAWRPCRVLVRPLVEKWSWKHLSDCDIAALSSVHRLLRSHERKKLDRLDFFSQSQSNCQLSSYVIKILRSTRQPNEITQRQPTSKSYFDEVQRMQNQRRCYSACVNLCTRENEKERQLEKNLDSLVFLSLLQERKISVVFPTLAKWMPWCRINKSSAHLKLPRSYVHTWHVKKY